jgi:hypothetical protein
MIPGLEPLYQQIAESIENAIPEDWNTAKMDAVFFPDGSQYTGEYTRASDGVARGFATALAGERAFREIRKLFEESDQPTWGRASFELQSNGTFNMKWGYDDCDGNGFARFVEEQELRRSEERRQRLTRG